MTDRNFLGFSSRKVVIGIIVVVAGLGLLRLIFSNSGSKNVLIEVAFPANISYGMPFQAKVAVTNRSDVPFDSASLSVTLPSGVSFLDKPDGQTIAFRELKGLDQGERHEEAFDLIAYNSSSGNLELKAALSYAQSGVTSKFEESKTFTIPVQGNAIQFVLTPPATITEGEEFPIDVAYQNVTDATYPYVLLHLDLPEHITLRTTLQKDNATGDFIIGDLSPGETGTSTLKATITESLATTTIHAALTTNFGKSFIRTIAEQSVNLPVQSSPIQVNITANDDPNFIASLGDSISYTVAYENGSDTPIQNVSLKVQLVGSMFDFTTLQTNGVWNPADNTVRWNQFSNSEFETVAPHSSGNVSFQVRTLGTYPIRRLSDRNFTFKADVEFDASQPSATSSTAIVRRSHLETKVNGALSIQSLGYFRDAASGVLNNGSLPLKVGSPTDFTIHWLVTNYATDMNMIHIVGKLGDGIAFTNSYQNQLPGTTFAYHPEDHTVTWDIPSLSATRGILDAPPSVVFQVEATPSSGDVGKPMTLLGDVTLSATDNFTSSTISSSAGAITSIGLADPTVGQTDGIVVP